jgi:hypothetical protein
MNANLMSCGLAFAAAALMSQGALGQAASSPMTRADVKAETRAAAKGGKLAPTDEGVVPGPATEPKSNKSRAERKAETKAARAKGELEPTGEAGDLKSDPSNIPSTSTKTRAQRRAEVRAAEKAHAIPPAGEGPDAPKR